MLIGITNTDLWKYVDDNDLQNLCVFGCVVSRSCESAFALPNVNNKPTETNLNDKHVGLNILRDKYQDPKNVLRDKYKDLLHTIYGICMS